MQSAISRTQTRDVTDAMLTVSVDTGSGAYWRVTIYNRDDQPLHDVKIAAFEMPRRVVFRREAGRSYRLIAGNSRATAPQYDLARVVGPDALDAASAATLGPIAVKTDYADPQPWTEQHPVLPWAAALVAVVVIGGLAVRALRSA